MDTGNRYKNNGTTWVLYGGGGGGITASSTTTFTNKTMSGASNTFSSIPVNSLANFAVSGPTTDQVIQYNGSNWINATAASGGGGITASSADTFTNKELDIDATGNKLRNFHQASWIIYRPSGAGTIKAYNVRTGVVNYSHATDLNTVLQSTLDAADYSTIYISDHLTGAVTYAINASGFTGFQLGYRQHIIMGRNAKIQVPNAYAGVVFKLFNSNTKTCFANKIEGGHIFETGTPVRDWTAFQIYSNKTSSGGDFNEISGTRIDDCKTAVEFKLDNTANTWINDCTIKDLTIFTPKVGFDFVLAGANSAGINRNLFQNILLQGAAHTTHGAKNVSGAGNLFIKCKFLNLDLGGATGRTATLAASADRTMIVGGQMGYTGANMIEDSSDSQNTTLIDPWNFTSARLRPFSMPSLRNPGMFSGTSATTGDGIFCPGFTAATGHSTSQGISATDGKYTRYTTASSAGAVAGIRFNIAIAMRSWNPRLKCKFRVNSAWGAASRLFLGFWQGYATDPANNDTQTDSTHCMMLYTRPADTAFTVCRNAGGATAQFTTANLSSIDTGVHVVEFIGDERNSRWNWKMDSNAITISGTGPGSTELIGITAMIQTTNTTPKTLDIFYLETEGDK